MPTLPNSTPRWFSFYRNLDEFKAAINKANRNYVTLKNNSSIGYAPRVDADSTLGTKKIPDLYPNMGELTDFINKYDEFKQTIDTGGAFKKQRLKLSEDKRFLFDFGLASKGLFRVPEYFSDDVAKDYPDMFNSIGEAASDETMVAGVVDVNLVQSIDLADNKTAFYIAINGKDYVLRQQQKGTAKMLLLNTEAKLVQADSGMFYTEPTIFDGFTLKFASSFKKSYIEIPKKGGDARAVDLYIPFDLITPVTADRKMASAVPLILASEFFNLAKIKTRINILRAITTDGKQYGPDVSSIVAITIKDFDDPLDWNKIAVLRALGTANSAVTQANGYINREKNKAYTIETGAYGGQTIIGAEGSSGANILMYDNEVMLQEEFGRYKNWFRDEVKNGNIKTKLVEKPLMMVIGTQGLLRENFSSAIKNPAGATDTKIKAKFFELLDATDLHYNEKTGEVIKRIITRYEKEGKQTSDVKSYVINLLGKVYKDYEPSSGPYISTPEEQAKANDEYKEKLKKVGAEFQKLGI